MPDTDRIVVVPRHYIRGLLAIVIGLVVIHLGLHVYHDRVEKIPWLIRQLFELDEENNLPTWFSGFLLLNVAFVLFVTGSTDQGRNRTYWLLLALGFLVLSIDEVAGLHESLNTAIDMNWAIPGGILVVVVGVFFIPFLLSLERRLALLIFLSGLLYVSGAIVVELLSADMDEKSLAYGLATATEEGMEMFGAWLFLKVLLNEMAKKGRVGVDVLAQRFR